MAMVSSSFGTTLDSDEGCLGFPRGPRKSLVSPGFAPRN